MEAMNESSIVPTKTDVVFGKRLNAAPNTTTATKRMLEILGEHYQGHCNASECGRFKIEVDILNQVKKELPDTVRFLQFFPDSGEAMDNNKECSLYRVMTDDHQVLDAISIAFARMRKDQKRKMEKKVHSTGSTPLQPLAPSPDSIENISLLEMRNTPPMANFAHGIAHPVGTPGGGHNMYHGQHQNNNVLFSNSQKRLNDLRVMSAFQAQVKNAMMRHEHNCQLANAMATHENTPNTTASNKRPIEDPTAPETNKKVRRVSLSDTTNGSERKENSKTEQQQQLASLFHGNRNKQMTIDLLFYQNTKLNDRIVGLEHKVDALQHLVQVEAMQRQPHIQWPNRVLSTANHNSTLH